MVARAAGMSYTKWACDQFSLRCVGEGSVCVIFKEFNHMHKLLHDFDHDSTKRFDLLDAYPRRINQGKYVYRHLVLHEQ